MTLNFNEPVAPTIDPLTLPPFAAATTELLKRGIPVIPIPPKCKDTRLTDWPSEATTDPVKVGKWLKANPYFNCGAVATNNGHCMFDSDTKELIEQIEKDSGQKIPKTFTVQSSKGLHTYFTQNDETRALGNRKKAGIFDFQQNAKYVVAPYSIHPTGVVYLPVDHSACVPCPSFLCKWISAHSTPTYVPFSRPDLTDNLNGSQDAPDDEEIAERREQFEADLDYQDVSWYEPKYLSHKRCWLYILADGCPWKHLHTNKDGWADACVMIYDDGVRAFHCCHNSCADTANWQDYKAYLEEQTGHPMHGSVYFGSKTASNNNSGNIYYPQSNVADAKRSGEQ